MKCPKCRADNPDTSRFCGSCAALLSVNGQAPDSITRTLVTPLHAVSKDNLIAGKYRILEEIGRGGMGVVYKAEDIKLKRCAALKFLPPHLMHSLELKERFLIEAQAAAALSHPNICVIYEVGEAENQSYIAMEYVEGETLRDKIKNGPLAPEDAIDITSQVATGLGEAHGKGIIHRDIKSANIMVTVKSQAKVMDFGLAKLRGGTSLTKSQTTLGTVAYMSPEQARGDQVDQRTDIWSLGVVLYEMLTGELPFRGDYDQPVIHSILYSEPKPPSKIREGLPPGLDQIVGQALTKDAGNRYQTMEELREDLAAVAEGLRPIKARPAKKFFGIRRAHVYSALAIALALALVFNVGGLRTRLTGGAPAAAKTFKLAVLPFENLTGDPEQEFLSDGLTQDMISELGRLQPARMSVIGLTSVMRYKKSDAPLEQISRELGVGYILGGSCRREAVRVRISVELIQVRDQAPLWTETYEREMSGLLALQSEVARNVARALALKLLPGDEERLAKVRSVDPEAYEAYHKGIQQRELLTKAGFDAAESYFNLAVEKDSGYAAGWAGIASVWNSRMQLGMAPRQEALPKAKAAALKALALDDRDFEARRILAGIMTWADWDWVTAERAWNQVFEIEPSNPTALSGYAHYLMVTGRPEEAMAAIERALALDPYNVRTQSFYAQVLLGARRYDDAIAVARKALSIQPGTGVATTALIASLFKKGLYDELMAFEKERWAKDPELIEALEKGHAEGGYRRAIKRFADILAARYGKPGGLTAYPLAIYFARAGDAERVIEWLEKANEEHNNNLPYMRTPVFDAVRDDPRFQDLVRRVGLPTGEKK